MGKVQRGVEGQGETRGMLLGNPSFLLLTFSSECFQLLKVPVLISLSRVLGKWEHAWYFRLV